jgi:hypothetical protein
MYSGYRPDGNESKQQSVLDQILTILSGKKAQQSEKKF